MKTTVKLCAIHADQLKSICRSSVIDGVPFAAARRPIAIDGVSFPAASEPMVKDSCETLDADTDADQVPILPKVTNICN
jgi:hypothetical protein